MKKVFKSLSIALILVLSGVGLTACGAPTAGVVGTKFEVVANGWADDVDYDEIYKVSLVIDAEQVTLSDITAVTFKIFKETTEVGKAVLKSAKISELFGEESTLPSYEDDEDVKALNCFFMSKDAEFDKVNEFWTWTPAKTTLEKDEAPTKIVVEVLTKEEGKNYIYTVEKAITA